MIVRTDEEFVGLKKIGHVVAQTIETMRQQITPGITTGELDEIGAKVLAQHGAQSAPKVMYNFPGFTCISINEEAAHGVPGDRVIREGDIVNIDVSAELAGYFADSGRTFLVPPFTETQQRLVTCAKQTQENAMLVAKAGRKLNVIGKSIEQSAEKFGFEIIEDLGSHGIGKKLHESPDFIAPYFDADDKRVLQDGLVITIEPFLSLRSRSTTTANDQWTLLTEQGNLSAQFEHTLIIRKGKPYILTSYE
ncbi:type I methionyl aminopeptidase [Algicola sagamiensis]|uniref:type I methionyl aminopeptidase n=1 Tax=Algicola sagamiensis TaxID=163869 RepID=UPI000367AF7B|nr:type I methionyl aminopeptidase [Algicola sagamiensis]